MKKSDHTHETRASFTIPKYKKSLSSWRGSQISCTLKEYFAEGKQRDNNANEIQKHLQLYDLSLGEYLVNKYTLWLDLRMIDENELHGTGRHIENASEGITLQIEKKQNQLGLSMLTFTQSRMLS